MKLSEILKDLEFNLISGTLNVDIKGISEDSRKISSGVLFLAREGLETNGHLYIDDAIERGAPAKY